MIDYNFVPHSIQEIASELFAETLFSESPWESIVTTEEATITKLSFNLNIYDLKSNKHSCQLLSGCEKSWTLKDTKPFLLDAVTEKFPHSFLIQCLLSAWPVATYIGILSDAGSVPALRSFKLKLVQFLFRQDFTNLMCDI